MTNDNDSGVPSLSVVVDLDEEKIYFFKHRKGKVAK